MAEAFQEFAFITKNKTWHEHASGPEAWAKRWTCYERVAESPVISESMAAQVFLTARMGRGWYCFVPESEVEVVKLHGLYSTQLDKLAAVTSILDLCVHMLDRSATMLLPNFRRKLLTFVAPQEPDLPSVPVLVEPAPETDRQQILSDAFRNRELLATLMQDDWLGLRLLTHLRLCKRAPVLELASNIQPAQMNTVVTILFRLIQHGMADVQGVEFVSTAKGNRIVETLEEKTGTSFHE